ncbi:serine/threonine-protein phosphatase 6 regulatory ankyrin repeat subunit C [Gossypium hirsutum]|uniref:Serine/threonine-protein phosphatase 6 regulatory ankyrin repeat subunit C n=1 Tax=Gossypium hirsutum TaxID=3635 RepID=A0ABM3ASR6_GOSHI|nr:serine/threonine-protein phosphatase 6 regulatory ankyrin repeat subunit C [Gossypium hirsutum]
MLSFTSGVILPSSGVVKSSGGAGDSDHSDLEASVVKEADSSRVVEPEKRPRNRNLVEARSLLHVAVSSSHPEVVKLLSAAADESVVNGIDEEGWAPIHSAASIGNLEIMEILLSKADVTYCYFLIYFFRRSKCELLIEEGAEVDATERARQTPLMSRYIEIVAALNSLNVAVEQMHAEAGNGQYEMALGYTACTYAADNLIFTREVVKAIANKHGLLATFVPKRRHGDPEAWLRCEHGRISRVSFVLETLGLCLVWAI